MTQHRLLDPEEYPEWLQREAREWERARRWQQVRPWLQLAATFALVAGGITAICWLQP